MFITGSTRSKKFRLAKIISSLKIEYTEVQKTRWNSYVQIHPRSK